MSDPRSEKEIEAAEKLLVEIALLQIEGLSLGEVLASALSDYPKPLDFLRKSDVGTIRAELVRKRLARELARFKKKCRECGSDLGSDSQALSLGFCSGTCARAGQAAAIKHNSWELPEYWGWFVWGPGEWAVSPGGKDFALADYLSDNLKKDPVAQQLQALVALRNKENPPTAHDE